MTPIEIRSMFKMDTGEYPLWNTYGNKNNPSFLHGKKKSIYGLWLENKFEKSKGTLRAEFYSETSCFPTYKLQRNVNYEYLNSFYMEWLEDKLIKKLSLPAQFYIPFFV